MSKFKDNVSSKVFMWIGFGLAVLAVLMMFVPGLEHFQVLATKDRFWNITGATHGFENGIWPVFVGYMLVLVGALILLVLALPFVNPQGKTEFNQRETVAGIRNRGRGISWRDKRIADRRIKECWAERRKQESRYHKRYS